MLSDYLYRNFIRHVYLHVHFLHILVYYFGIPGVFPKIQSSNKLIKQIEVEYGRFIQKENAMQ